MINQNIVDISILQEYYFSGNIPIIQIDSNEDLEIQIKLLNATSSVVIDITEVHTPDFSLSNLSGIIHLDISELVSAHLFATYPADTTLEDLGYVFQHDAAGTVTISPEGAASASFRVIKGIVDEPLPVDSVPFNFQSYIAQNLLSLRPQISEVAPTQPNALSVYIVGPTVLYAVATILTGYVGGIPQYHTSSPTPYLSLSGTNRLVTFDATFNTLAGLFFPPPSLEVVQVDIYAQNTSTSAKTAPIRLVRDSTIHQYPDLFAFENSMGGIDIILFTGVLSKAYEHEYLSLKNQKHHIEYETIPKTTYKKNTGYFQTDAHASFAADFLASSNKFHYRNQKFSRIYITDKDAPIIQGNINAFTFSFAYAYQNPGQLLTNSQTL